MAEYIGAAIEVIKFIGGPIKSYFNYLCCFNANIRKLRDEATKLDEAKIELEGRVDAATRNAQVIVPRVVTWLDDVSQIQAERTRIDAEIGNVGSGCLAIKSRFLLSRKASKMAASTKLLHDGHSNFGEICHPPLPVAVAPIPLGQIFELQSRKHLEDDIMATLREKKVSMMGICGMGGVGKTVMAKKIMSRAREEGLFDEIVMVVVSQPVDMQRIHREMAESFGLKLEVESTPATVHRLHARLTNDKSKLIVLDDLWKRLNLEDLGMSMDLRKCTILLASRNRDILREMNVDRCFQMETLEYGEAWSLFKEQVGASAADDPNLFPLAQDIVRECKGLPIALVTIGVALRDEKSEPIWKDAVGDLRSGYPQDIPDFLELVYNPLKLSYELLQSEHARLIFLMCCLFPEDHDIRVSDLSLYAWGLNIFEGITSVQDARNKVQTLVKKLKSRSLLLDGFRDGYVKMHDVVRDVGIFIAGTKGLIDPNLSSKSWTSNYSIDCSWISLFNAKNMKLIPEGSVFPNLHFLLMEGQYLRYWEREHLPLSDNFSESAAKLNVLSIKNYKLETLQLQKNLRTLILEKCSSLGDISIVGELTNLEVLICYCCETMKELPIEISRLNQLKLLNVSNCSKLDTIPAGVISRLRSLQELTLINSFSNWESASSQGTNAALCELNFLSSLTTLRIQISNASLAAQQIHLSPNLAEFSVQIGSLSEFERGYGRQVELDLEREVMIGDWIHQLLRTTECLHLRREAAITISSNSFINLQELSLAFLPKLQHLGKDYLFRLKRISIQFCSMLEQVMFWDELETQSNNTFPKLEKLSLRDLPRLTSFCKGIQNIEFPLLRKMEIVKCPNMKNLVSSGAMKHDEAFFCKSKVAFGKLEKLYIYGYESTSSEVSGLWCDQISMDFSITLIELTIFKCGNFKSLFSLSTAINFVNLKNIVIDSCSTLEQVVSWNEEENGPNSPITFSKLEKLSLFDLPRLTFFGKGIQSIEFPLLSEMGIMKCPNLKSLVSSMGSEFRKCSNEDSLHLFCKPDQAAFGRLKRLDINGYGSISSEVSGLWCDQIPIDFLTGLVDLKVTNCGNIKSLFSFSTATNLVNLKSIKVHSCSILEQVVLWKEDKSNRNHHRLTFPKLETLQIDDLPRLTCFCKGIQSIEFPLLNWMEIVKCPNLKSMVSSMENDKECFGTINHDDDDSLHLFCKPQVAFGRLEKLKLCGYESEVSELWCDQITMDFFTTLVELTITNCGNIKTLFSLTVATNLVNLKNIEIESCSKLEQLVLWNEEENGLNSPITFPKLEILQVEDLPRLTFFCKGIQSIEFPLLTRMEIEKCPNLKTLVSSMENDFKKCSNEESLHLFCKSQVKFGRLEELRIRGYETRVSGLWCDQISMDFCTTLAFLTIRNCANIKSIFSLTVATNFVTLKNIKIESCSKLEQVVSWNEEENGHNSPITFPKLEKLHLDDLPRLTFFCKGIQSIEFPLLTQMEIEKCPNLKTLVSSMENDFKNCSNEESLHLFCKSQVICKGKVRHIICTKNLSFLLLSSF